MLMRIMLVMGLLLFNQAWSKPVDVSQVDTKTTLTETLYQLEDASASLTLKQVIQHADWQPLDAVTKKTGVTPSAFWLKLTLTNASAHPVTRWLAAGSSLTQNVQYYQVDGQHQLLRFVQSGYHFPLKNRPVETGLFNLIDIQLAPAETQTIYIRLKTNNTLVLSADLWNPVAYREFELGKKVGDLVLLSIAFTIGLFLFLGGAARRDWLLLSVGGWLLCYVLYEFVFLGYAYQHLFSSGEHGVLFRPMTFAMLAFLFFIVFLYLSLQLKDSPLLRLFMKGAFVVFALIPFITFFDVHLAINLANYATLVFMLLSPWIIVLRWKKRAPNTGVLLAAALIVVLFMSQRMLYLFDAFTYPLVQMEWVWFSLVLLIGVLMLAGFTQRVAAGYYEKIAMQNAFIAYQNSEKNQLENAVKARTHALKTALIKADEANRAKSDFLARVSHDLKSPLTSILGYSQQISAHERDEVAQKSTIIYNSARRLLALVNDLIDYATGDKNPNNLQPKATYTLSLFHSIAEEARYLAKMNHNAFDYKVVGDLPRVVEVDAKRVHQILINLLSNACKFTQQGRVSFIVDGEWHSNQSQCHLTIRVQDTGCGIEKTHLTSIFEPFTKINPELNAEGIGLGLSIAKQWADAMKATLVAHSEPGQGTTMTLSLDLTVGCEEAIVRHDLVINNAALASLDGQQRNVWVVEDSPVIAQLLLDELALLNFSACAMTSAEEALAAIEQAQTPAPDLILTDFNLPGANGKTLLMKVRARWPEQKVVLISAAYTNEADDADAEMETPSFSAVLIKPIDLADFRKTLAELFDLHAVEAVAPSFEQQTKYDDYESVLNDIRQALNAEEKAQLRELIEVYAVTDIIIWAEALKQTKPALTAPLEQLMQFARDSHLTALKRLIERV